MKSVIEYIRSQPDELARAWSSRSALKHLDIEVRLDWRCNAKCKFCGVWKYDRSDLLPAKRWLTLFDELACEGLRRVLFTGGEPMIVPYFHDVLEHVDAMGVEAAIITNGSMLKEAHVGRLASLRHLRSVTVSLDSGDPRIHDEVRNFRGLFGLAVKGMARLRSIAPQIRLTVNSVISSSTAATIERLLDLPVLPDEIRVFPVDLDLTWLNSLSCRHEDGWSGWAAEAKQQKLCDEDRWAALGSLSRLSRKAADRGVDLVFDRMTMGGDPFTGNCYVPLAHFVVQPNGDVYPCCHVQDRAHRVGRLKTQTAGEVLASEEYRTLLSRLQPASLESCSRCSRYRKFNELAEATLAGRR